MRARWTASFCSGDGRQAGLLYLAAGYRDTTGQRVTYHYRSHKSERVERETVDVSIFIGRMVQLCG